MTIQSLRQSFLALRSKVSTQIQQTTSSSIIHSLKDHVLFKKNHVIAGYWPFRSEIDLSGLISICLELQKEYCLPILAHQKLLFAPYNFQTPLKENRYKIPEPVVSSNHLIIPEKLDLVLTPLVAFTPQGYRLGMGKGYYDRTFNFLLQKPKPLKPFLLGIAYDWQKIDHFIPNEWDVPLDGVMTEKAFYTFDGCVKKC